jgi:hypothetical protein
MPPDLYQILQVHLAFANGLQLLKGQSTTIQEG